MALASGGIFSLKYPQHKITQIYKKIAEIIIKNNVE